jgi:hypothetical protein
MSADIEIIRAPMGGAWACPLTDDGETTLQAFFDEEPVELRPLCDRVGYIVEPFEVLILAEHLRACNVTWEQG